MTLIQLGGYPAKKCPRVTHNENSPYSPPRPAVNADLQQLFDEGLEFEALVTDELLVAHPEAYFVDTAHVGWERSVQLTLEAMQRGEPVIVNGRLPEVDGRVGAPDVLVRLDGAYLPVDIKHHKTFGTQKRAVLTWSSLQAPTKRLLDPARSGNGPHRGDDTMQLAHYMRMLVALGYGGPDRHGTWGGIIGTSDFTDLQPGLSGHRHGITWYDLDAAHETTYSASAPNHRRQRSAMERYDHEFDFRMEVARAAHDGRELVRPIGTQECWDCGWQDYCADVVGPDDASFAFTAGRLDAREWKFLASHGGTTIEGLAALSADALVEDFRKHAVSKRNVPERLAAAIQRARMIRDEVSIEPLGEWPAVPVADVEIDFDIETDSRQRIYQWGLRVRRGHDDTTAEYQHDLVSFDDDFDEEALADAFCDRLEKVIAEAGGGSVVIFHWSSVEVTRTARFPRVQQLLAGRTFDLMTWMQAHFRVVSSYSIKDVAGLFDFHWGVDDAGGFRSMRMVEAARMGNDDAARWCLEYNEADVAAQAAIRDGLRALQL